MYDNGQINASKFNIMLTCSIILLLQTDDAPDTIVTSYE